MCNNAISRCNSMIGNVQLCISYFLPRSIKIADYFFIIFSLVQTLKSEFYCLILHVCKFEEFIADYS